MKIPELGIFYISNVLEVSAWRLCSFCLDLAAAKTPGVQRVRYAKPQFAATAMPSVTSRHDDHEELCVLVPYPG